MKRRPIASNMTEVTSKDCIVLYSYSTPVAAILNTIKGVEEGRPLRLKTSNKYSQTTSKHINKWFAGHDNVEIVDQKVIDFIAEGDVYSGVILRNANLLRSK